jgi:hypothetical protein
LSQTLQMLAKQLSKRTRRDFSNQRTGQSYELGASVHAADVGASREFVE